MLEYIPNQRFIYFRESTSISPDEGSSVVKTLNYCWYKENND